MTLSWSRYFLGAGLDNLVVESHGQTFADIQDSYLELDLYSPADRSDRVGLPAVIVIHGGSWSEHDSMLTASCESAVGGVRAVISLYGPIDLAWGYHHPLRPDIINSRRVLENYLGGSPEQLPDAYARASPTTHIGPGSPPTLLIHGGRDQLVSNAHADRAAPLLKRAGVAFEYLYLPFITRTTIAMTRIALVGEHNQQYQAHIAIPRILEMASTSVGAACEADWVPTDSFGTNAAGRLDRYDAIWCVPGSPYASMEGALSAIRFARESGRPFLGTCGGFQHALIEYVRNVLGYHEADHAESNPGASLPLIAPLTCSLVGTSGTIVLAEGSRAATIFGGTETVEEYHCNFGFDARYRPILSSGELQITGVDEHGEARIVEIAEHPFFIATLFQPERRALTGHSHLLVEAFLRAAAEPTEIPANGSFTASTSPT